MLVKAVVDGRDELAEGPIGQMRMHLTKAMPQTDGEGNDQAAEDGKPAEWHDRWRDEPGLEPLVGALHRAWIGYVGTNCEVSSGEGKLAEVIQLRPSEE